MRKFHWLLALLFCMQSSLALAHCGRLRMAMPAEAGAFLVVICTSQGLVTVDMSSPGDRDEAPQQAKSDLCLACHVMPSIDLPAPIAIATPLALPVEARFVQRHAALPSGARSPPYHPTGPPLNA